MLSVRDSRELQASVLALKAADRELRSTISKATVQVGNQIWQPLVTAHATTHLDTRMLAVGARVKGGNPPVAMAANSRRALGRTKRLVPADRWPAFEFGANRESYSRYTRRSANGGTHTVARRTMKGLPPRNRKGRVVYPAFARAAPRMVSLWVQTIVKAYNDAAERRR
jgi:hypothetical protein